METKMDLRVGDRERDATADALREHAAAGRLDPEELEQRLEAAYAARTQADLDRLTYDLPAREALPAKRERSLPPGAMRLILSALAADVLAIAIWLANGDAADGGWDEFWPKWVFILTTVIVVRRLLRLRRDDGEDYRKSDST
jgi:Domain of unknown function (DUF1707)